MEKMIDILIVEPGKAPRPARVVHTLENLQDIVGGQLEIGCFLPQRVLLICNENGKSLGLVPNRRNPGTEDYIAGTFLLCGLEGDGFGSLTAAQQQEFQRRFAKPGEFMVVGADTVCSTFNELLLAAYKLWDDMGDGDAVVLTKLGSGGTVSCPV